MVTFFIRRFRNQVRLIHRIANVVNFWHPYLFKVQIPVVGHCNLGCKSCGTCAPLVEEEFADLGQVEKDLSELSRKLSISTIGLIGGEPLLHPEIEKFPFVIRRYYSKVMLTLSTNGIRLPEMSQTFWDAMRENKVTILLQCYPPFKHKLEGYLRLAREKSVRIGNASHEWWLYRYSFDADTSMREKNYAVCTDRMVCHQLWRSKLYLCPRHWLRAYNHYFGTSHEILKGYDIYKYSGWELQKLMKRSDPCCRYCTFLRNPVETEWDYSKHERWEWCADDGIPME